MLAISWPLTALSCREPGEVPFDCLCRPIHNFDLIGRRTLREARPPMTACSPVIFIGYSDDGDMAMMAQYRRARHVGRSMRAVHARVAGNVTPSVPMPTSWGSASSEK